MKTGRVWIAALLLLGSGLVGCSKKDDGGTGNAPPNVPQAGGKSANVPGGTGGTEKPKADFASAETITSTVVPELKKAVEAETSLTGPDNKITVEAKDKNIQLTGEVKDNDAKKKAGEVVEAALKTMSAPADIKVNNTLISKKH